MTKYNFKFTVNYLSDKGKDDFNMKTAKGSFRGFNYNGSLRFYFLDLFKKNIDDIEVYEDEDKFIISNRTSLSVNFLKKVAFETFNKTVIGICKQFSNADLNYNYEVVRCGKNSG